MRALDCLPVCGPACFDFGPVAEARERGDLRGCPDVVPTLDLSHRRDQGRRPDAVADPEARQPVELRECPQRQHVVSCPHEIGDRVEPAGRLEIVEVRLVEHRQYVLWKLADEGEQIVACRHPPRRVVRRCDEEQPRPWRDRLSHRLEVDPTVEQRHGDDDGVALLWVANEARERRPRHDDLVARIEHGLADVADHGVGPCCHDDLRRRHAVPFGERNDQIVRATARIAVQLGQRPLDGLERRRERPAEALVEPERRDTVRK